jgi:hypothetical protein
LFDIAIKSKEFTGFNEAVGLVGFEQAGVMSSEHLWRYSVNVHSPFDRLPEISYLSDLILS